MAQVRYVVGIDVGLFSVGLAALKVDDDGVPTEILSAISKIHDCGLDPDGVKAAVSRLAASGVARRTRRLIRRRRKRLIKLDKFIARQGWEITDLAKEKDPYLPWLIRAELATKAIADDDECFKKLAIAIRHIARHRGWRNPYKKVSSLYLPSAPSAAFLEVKAEITKVTGIPLADDLTVGQMLASTKLTRYRLRGDGGLICARLQQSDHANEIRKICEVQGIENDLYKEIINHVFMAESPKGSASSRVGKDPLPGQQHLPRALKAQESFQKYRIAALLGNLRIKDDDGSIRELTQIEKEEAFNFLCKFDYKREPEWQDISDLLSIDRGQLRGTATMTDDGERAGARPPINQTTKAFKECIVKPISDFWAQANTAEKRELIKALSNAEISDLDSQAGAKVHALLASLSDDEQERLENLRLSSGRAAYSEDSLERLTDLMITSGLDLYHARRQAFGVSESWVPPAPAIAEPLGNPSVDRVLKIVANWLEAVVRCWGDPERVTIEHVREGFMSVEKSRELDREMQKRAKRNEELVKEMCENLGVSGRFRRADLWRFMSIQRQNQQCAYCGKKIDFRNSEMDHIVPRAGQGSTNTRNNLLAVCHDCNLAKGKIPFAVWAGKTDKQGVSVAEAQERTYHWIPDPGMNKKDFNKFCTEVRSRLAQEHKDEEIDARSMESVAWMANELRARIAQRFANGVADSVETKVSVYRGVLTAEARKASGLDHKIRFIGGVGKTRLDRRHHAVDAAVVSMLTPMVAETLAIRKNLRDTDGFLREDNGWKEFTGTDYAHQQQYAKWLQKMEALLGLLQRALDDDEIVVNTNLRLRVGNGRAHEDSIRVMRSYYVGDELSAELIDRASSEALWCALTRHPDFDPAVGLPKNSNRVIRVRDKHLKANDVIEFFAGNAGAIAVRGGYAELGAAFHHARIYRIPGKKNPSYCMMRVYTVDLKRFGKVDLFSVELPPQSITVRQCEPKLRKALAENTAEYLGWLVTNDEIYFDGSQVTSGFVAEIQKELGTINRWRVDGFFSDTKLRLRPLLLSAEGLAKDASDACKKILDRPGYCVSVNVLFNIPGVKVIRRTSLGKERKGDNSPIPSSWGV